MNSFDTCQNMAQIFDGFNSSCHHELLDTDVSVHPGKASEKAEKLQKKFWWISWEKQYHIIYHFLSPQSKDLLQLPI